MINGAHIIIYSTDADADRAFFRDVLGYPNIDTGGGWLMFKLPPAELAIHPSDKDEVHELFFMCDDVEATREELAALGVELVAPVTDEGWGLMTSFRLPGGGRVGLYEPRHERAADL